MAEITSLTQLRSLYAKPNERAVKKDIGRLDKHCRALVELSPFVIISSANARGQLDASPRGGHPGFVKVLDEQTLIIPDWGGNNRLDTLENIVQTGRAGLMFMLPGVNEVLRINGEALLDTGEQYRAQCAERGKLPKLVLVLKVEEAFLHCAKAIMRAGLWLPESQLTRSSLPTIGQMLKDQLNSPGEPESQQAMEARYNKVLY